jgi:hypothetical protein
MVPTTVELPTDWDFQYVFLLRKLRFVLLYTETVVSCHDICVRESDLRLLSITSSGKRKYHCSSTRATFSSKTFVTSSRILFRKHHRFKTKITSFIMLKNKTKFRNQLLFNACGNVVGWSTMLQAGKSRVRFPMRSLDFSIDLIVAAALRHLGLLSL